MKLFLCIIIILLMIRPFICSICYPKLNFGFSLIMQLCILPFLIFRIRKINLSNNITIPFILWITILFVHATIFDTTTNIKLLYLNFISLFLLSFTLNSDEELWIISTLIFTLILVSLHSLYQFIFGFKNLKDYINLFHIKDYFIQDYILRKRIFYPFSTPNLLASFLSIIIPLIWGFWHKKYKTFAIISYLISIPSLILTKSLGGMSSVLIGMCIIYGIKLKFITKKHIFFVLILILIIFTCFFQRSLSFKSYRKPFFSLEKRIQYWNQTWKIIKSHPFKGVGLGNLNIPSSLYTHNLYLQLGAELGIIGLLSFLFFVFTVLRIGIKKIKNTFQASTVSLFLSIIIFLLHNFWDFSFYIPEVSIFWWIILGLGCKNFLQSAKIIENYK